MPSSRGSSQPREPTCDSYISCIATWVLSLWHLQGSPNKLVISPNPKLCEGRGACEALSTLHRPKSGHAGRPRCLVKLT